MLDRRIRHSPGNASAIRFCLWAVSVRVRSGTNTLERGALCLCRRRRSHPFRPTTCLGCFRPLSRVIMAANFFDPQISWSCTAVCLLARAKGNFRVAVTAQFDALVELAMRNAFMGSAERGFQGADKSQPVMAESPACDRLAFAQCSHRNRTAHVPSGEKLRH